MPIGNQSESITRLPKFVSRNAKSPNQKLMSKRIPYMFTIRIVHKNPRIHSDSCESGCVRLSVSELNHW